MSRKNRSPVVWIGSIQALLLALLLLLTAGQASARVEDPIQDPTAPQEEDGDGDEWPESAPPPNQISLSHIAPSDPGAVIAPRRHSGRQSHQPGREGRALIIHPTTGKLLRWVWVWKVM